MRKSRISVIASALLLAGIWGVGTPHVAQAAKAPGITVSPESKIWFDGDSTLHGFSFKSKKHEVTAAGSASGARLDKLEVEIPVKQLKSGDGTMDGNMYRALDADKYPTIRFSMNNAKVKATGGDLDVDAIGTLTIAGTEKPITLKAEGKIDGNTFRIKGSKELLMSEYGVKPPVISLLVAKISVKDRVVIRYDLTGTLDD
ncbi:YceI family protein [bacterium]|nr:YceI family protein [bacterium]